LPSSSSPSFLLPITGSQLSFKKLPLGADPIIYLSKYLTKSLLRKQKSLCFPLRPTLSSHDPWRSQPFYKDCNSYKEAQRIYRIAKNKTLQSQLSYLPPRFKYIIKSKNLSQPFRQAFYLLATSFSQDQTIFLQKKIFNLKQNTKAQKYFSSLQTLINPTLTNSQIFKPHLPLSKIFKRALFFSLTSLSSLVSNSVLTITPSLRQYLLNLDNNFEIILTFTKLSHEFSLQGFHINLSRLLSSQNPFFVFKK